MVTLYCVKCDYKIESGTKDKICKKCGLPMLVYDEYLEDLKAAKEAEAAEEEMTAGSEVSAVEEESSTVTATAATEETEVPAGKKEIPVEMEADVKAETETGTEDMPGYEEIISEGDESDKTEHSDESSMPEPLKTITPDERKEVESDSLMNGKEAMDWKDIKEAGSEADGDIYMADNQDSDEVDKAAEEVLKKGNKKKYLIVFAGIAVAVAGITAMIKILNKKKD